MKPILAGPPTATAAPAFGIELIGCAVTVTDSDTPPILVAGDDQRFRSVWIVSDKLVLEVNSQVLSQLGPSLLGYQ